MYLVLPSFSPKCILTPKHLDFHLILLPHGQDKRCFILGCLLLFEGRDTLYHLVSFLFPGYLIVPSIIKIQAECQPNCQCLPAASASRHPQRGQGGPKGHCGLAVHSLALSAPAERCVFSVCKSQKNRSRILTNLQT